MNKLESVMTLYHRIDDLTYDNYDELSPGLIHRCDALLSDIPAWEGNYDVFIAAANVLVDKLIYEVYHA